MTDSALFEGAAALRDDVEAQLTGAKKSARARSKVKDEEVTLSETLKDRYSTADRNNFIKHALEDDQFRNGVQWKTEHIRELESRAQTPIVVNMIQPAIEQGIAMLTANHPRFQSTGREDSDVNTAHFWSDIMSWVWYISRGNVQLKQLADDMYVKGMGVMMAYIDPEADGGNGEVMVKALNPLDLYLPPSSRDRFCRDADHMIIRTIETRRNLLRRYPDKRSEIDAAEDAALGSDRPDTDRYALEDQVIDEAGDEMMTVKKEVLDRYTRVKVVLHHILDQISGYERYLNEDEYTLFLNQPAVILYNVATGKEDIVTLSNEVRYYLEIAAQGNGMFHYMQDPQTGRSTIMPGPEHPEAIQGSTVAVGQVTMGSLIEQEVILDLPVRVDRIRKVESAGGQLLYKGILPIEDYPIVTFMNRHNRNPYPLSDVRFVKGLQEYVNKIRSLIIAHATNTTNQTVILARGAGLSKDEVVAEFSRAGTSVLESKVGDDQDVRKMIMVVAPPPLPNELYKNLEDAKQEIQHILGIYPLMQGDPKDAPSTFRGTVALDEYGQRRIRSKKDDIEAGLNQLAKVVVQLAQAIYTEPKVIRLFQPNNKPKTLELNRAVYDEFSGEVISRVNDVSVGAKDIIVVSGSTMPSNRWGRVESMKDLWREGILKDDETILRETDIQDVDEVIARTGRMAELEQVSISLKGKVGDLEGLIQTLRRELLHSEQRVELEKYKRGLATGAAKVESKANLEVERMRDARKEIESQVTVPGPAATT